MTDKTDSLNEKIIQTLIHERKTERLWRNIRFFIWLFIILTLIILIFAPVNRRFSEQDSGKPYVSLVRMTGLIMPGAQFSARRVIPLLNRAFADKKAKGVVLLVNSPGGSAVQASIIHDKILQLKQKYNKKVIVVGEDALASGAYLVATAADKIYVNRDTLTGSIGVIMSGFGFADAISKLGIQRRVFTAGANKDRLDPFLALKPSDIAKVHKVLNIAHQNFIDDVKAGRKNKLVGNRDDIFSGDFWTGTTAAQLGLADGTANLWEALKNEFNVTHYRNYSTKPSLLETIIKNVESLLPVHLQSNQQGIMAISNNH